MIEYAAEYPDVALSHKYDDNAAMHLVRNPGQYDVVVTLQWKGDGNLNSVLRPILRRYSVKAQLASRRTLDDDRQDLSYRLMLRDPARSRDLLSELQSTDGVGRVSLYRREDESEV